MEEAARLAWRSACRKYGVSDVSVAQLLGFGIIARGVLGARELSYDSPLELEFLYDEGAGSQIGPGAQRFYKFLARRIYLLLTSRTVSGAIYPIQARAEEGGASELVIHELAAYVSRTLPVMENARSIQARFLCGDLSLEDTFTTYRKKLLAPRVAMQEFSREIIDNAARENDLTVGENIELFGEIF